MNNFNDSFNSISQGLGDTETAVANQAGQAQQPPAPLLGPTASDINAAGAKGPTSLADVANRGMMTNTAMQTMQNIQHEQKMSQVKNAYQKLLEQGRKGADQIYQSAVDNYGEQVKAWIPPAGAFYDDAGTFMPHQYAKAVYVGVQKYKEQVGTEDQRKQAGTIVGNAGSRQEAAAGLLGSGESPDDYKSSLESVPVTPKTVNPLDDKLKQARIDSLNRSGSQKNQKDEIFDQAKKDMAQAKLGVMKIDAAIKSYETAKADATKSGMPTDDIDAKIAELTAERVAADEEFKARSSTVSEHAKSRSTAERAAYQSGIEAGIINPSIQKANDQYNELKAAGAPVPDTEADANMYKANIASTTANNTQDPIIAAQIHAKMTGEPDNSGVAGVNTPTVSDSGDPDIVAMIMADPGNAAVYNSSSDIDKAKMRAQVRQFLITHPEQ